MTMDKGEIVREYKAAENQKKQIEILADLNDCSKADIVAILFEAGALDNYKIAAYRRRGLIPADDAAPETAPETAPVAAAPVPAGVLELIESELENIASEYERALEVVRYVEELKAFYYANKKDGLLCRE